MGPAAQAPPPGIIPPSFGASRSLSPSSAISSPTTLQFSAAVGGALVSALDIHPETASWGSHFNFLVSTCLILVSKGQISQYLPRPPKPPPIDLNEGESVTQFLLYICASLQALGPSEQACFSIKDRHFSIVVLTFSSQSFTRLIRFSDAGPSPLACCMRSFTTSNPPPPR